MFKKKIFVILILIFLQGCGFRPIYSSNQMIKIYIEEIQFDGDWELNNFIQASLNRYNLKNIQEQTNNKDSEYQKYKIIVKTNYIKSSLTKDSTGKPTKYVFDINANFNLISKDINKNYVYNEKFNMTNFEDELLEKNYERSNKQNIANLIVNKFIIQYSHIK